MAESSTSAQQALPTGNESKHITEAEASLYDRQIRLWGVEAQNRMRSSTVLVLSLRSLAHETIKNLVLAGIGTLVVMDDDVVTEEDLGSGFLFREEDGAVGKNRTEAAAAQIESLNPLVTLKAIPTLVPFTQGSTAEAGSTTEMAAFLTRENVDVVVACDMTRSQLEQIDAAARQAGSMFYGAGTYGFYGYVFANLGESYEFVTTPKSSAANPNPSMVKRKLAYPTLSQAIDKSNWSLPHGESSRGGSPFRGLPRSGTKDKTPLLSIGLLALWEYEARRRRLPRGEEDQSLVAQHAKDLREALGVNEKAFKGQLEAEEGAIVEHLSTHASHHFPPTLAVLGGLLAQDVLRAVSKKDMPFANLLAVDTMSGTGSVVRWGMADAVEG